MHFPYLHEAYEHALHVEERQWYADKVKATSVSCHLFRYNEHSPERRSPGPYSRRRDGTQKQRRTEKMYSATNFPQNIPTPPLQCPSRSPTCPSYNSPYPPAYLHQNPFPQDMVIPVHHRILPLKRIFIIPQKPADNIGQTQNSSMLSRPISPKPSSNYKETRRMNATASSPRLTRLTRH